MPIATSPPTGMTVAQKAAPFITLGSTAELTGEIVMTLSPSDTLQHSHDELVHIDMAVYTKVKTITLAYAIAQCRIKFDMNASTGVTGYARIYKNGVAIGTERSTISSSMVTFTEDFAALNAVKNDTIELWAYRTGANFANVQNFRLYFTEAYPSHTNS